MLFKEYQKNWEIEHKAERTEYFRKYREAHKAKAKIDSHNHYIKNKTKTLERTKKNYNDNKEAHNKLTAGYYQKNKANVQEQHRIYYQENKEEIKSYRLKNREKINTWKNEYRKNKYSTNLEYKIKVILRGRLTSALKGNLKYSSTIKLLGCDIKYLKKHLEEKFDNGMNWNNYGYYGWHIDHIKPCASFDLSKPEQQRKCFHHTNLQPLWALDNIRKGAKL